MSGESDLLLDLLTRGGVVGILLVLIWAILTKRLVPGWALREKEEEVRLWRDLALRGTSLASQATEAVSRAVER